MLTAPFPMARRLNTLLAGLGMAVAMAVAIGWSGLRGLRGAGDDGDESWIRALHGVARMDVVLNQAAGLAWQRAGAVTAQERTRLDRDYSLMAGRMSRETATVKAAWPGSAQTVGDFERAFGDLLALGAQLRQAPAAGQVSRSDAARQAQFRSQFIVGLERMQVYLGSLGEQARGQAEAETRRMPAAARSALVGSLRWMVVLMGLALGGAFLWVWQEVALPWENLMNAVRRLAAGDLQAPIPGGGRTDELGALATLLGTFRQGLLRKRALEESERVLAEEVRGLGESRQELTDALERARGELAEATAHQERLSRQSVEATEGRRRAEEQVIALKGEQERLEAGWKKAEQAVLRAGEALSATQAAVAVAGAERAQAEAECARLQKELAELSPALAQACLERDAARAARDLLLEDLERERELRRGEEAVAPGGLPSSGGEDSPLETGDLQRVLESDLLEGEDAEGAGEGVAASPPSTVDVEPDPLPGADEEVVEPAGPEPEHGLDESTDRLDAKDERAWGESPPPGSSAAEITPAPDEGASGEDPLEPVLPVERPGEVQGAVGMAMESDSAGLAPGPSEVGTEGVEGSRRRAGGRRRRAARAGQLDLLGEPQETAMDEEIRSIVASGRVPGVDMEDAVQRLGLPRGDVEELLRRFVLEQGGTPKALRQAVESGDPEAARHQAQVLAAAAGHLSMHELRRHAKTIDLALKFGQRNLGPMVEDLEREASRVMAGVRLL